jgi:hypothetical protein
VRRILAAAWLVLALAVWNGFFDLYVSRGSREYLQRRAEFDAGLGPEPAMDAILAAARTNGLIAASLWAGLVLALGWLTVYVARPPRRN